MSKSWQMEYENVALKHDFNNDLGDDQLISSIKEHKLGLKRWLTQLAQSIVDNKNKWRDKIMCANHHMRYSGVNRYTILQYPMENHIYPLPFNIKHVINLISRKMVDHGVFDKPYYYAKLSKRNHVFDNGKIYLEVGDNYVVDVIIRL